MINGESQKVVTETIFLDFFMKKLINNLVLHNF